MTSINRRSFVKLGLAAGTLASLPSRAAAQDETQAVHALPELPYAYDALEPHIDARTMEIHHSKHHAGYVANLNAALANQPKFKAMSTGELIANLASVDDETLRTTLRNNGGGHVNHSLFWDIVGPAESAGEPTAELRQAIDAAFGSFEEMKKRLNAAATSRFGSGWAWLVVREGGLAVTSTPNQDHPQMAGIVPAAESGLPILGVDVWEHAYYLHYQNRRAEYLDAFWNVVQWPAISRRFAEAAQA